MYMTAEQESGSLELNSPFPGSIAAGELISIPFSFVVPQYLLEDSCNHHCASQAIWERHSHLPPTLDGANTEEHEFLARARIQYYVEMRLRFHENSVNDGDADNMVCAEHDNSRVIAGREMVSILPALPELPPLPLDSMNVGTFIQSKSISIRKNLLQRSGRLKVSSTQPSAMMLDPSGRSSPCSVLNLELDFFPSDSSSRPPKKIAVSGIALGTTHLCAEPSELLPEFSCQSSGTCGDENSPTTVNREARLESRKGYEAVGPAQSSHVHFGRDIFVCDASITEATSNAPLESLATRVERLTFWDCFPDDKRVELPYFYSTYLAASQAAASAAMMSAGSVPSSSGMAVSSIGSRLPAVDFDKLWFPKLRDLWIVKVAGVNRAWLIDAEAASAKATTTGATLHCPSSVPLSQHPQSRQTARKFRYWVQDNVVEMASLSLDDPDTRLVLREGRCGKPDCHELNRGRPILLSKVTFMEGKYHPSQGWLRIAPWDGRKPSGTSASGSSVYVKDVAGDNDAQARDCSRDSMRWVVVERILTFSLRCDDVDEPSRRHIRSQSHA
ncbi:hypothetical protein MY11210_007398 [Beauveria gryllotalpidicola]